MEQLISFWPSWKLEDWNIRTMNLKILRTAIKNDTNMHKVDVVSLIVQQ